MQGWYPLPGQGRSQNIGCLFLKYLGVQGVGVGHAYDGGGGVGNGQVKFRGDGGVGHDLYGTLMHVRVNIGWVYLFGFFGGCLLESFAICYTILLCSHHFLVEYQLLRKNELS